MHAVLDFVAVELNYTLLYISSLSNPIIVFYSSSLTISIRRYRAVRYCRTPVYVIVQFVTVEFQCTLSCSSSLSNSSVRYRAVRHCRISLYVIMQFVTVEFQCTLSCSLSLSRPCIHQISSLPLPNSCICQLSTLVIVGTLFMP